MSIKVSKHESMKENIRKKSALREWMDSIIVAFILAMIIRAFVVQPFKIPTNSMYPTLLPGDIILVNKFIYGARMPFTDLRFPALTQPKRGDVIVFIYPEDRKKNFIKRLVALGGQTLEIKNGTVYIDAQPLLDSVFSQRYYYSRGDLIENNQKILVPRNNFFVLGDNSAASQDSRYWGFVPYKNILGKAMLIYWPPQRIRIIK